MVVSKSKAEFMNRCGNVVAHLQRKISEAYDSDKSYKVDILAYDQGKAAACLNIVTHTDIFNSKKGNDALDKILTYIEEYHNVKN